MQIVQQLAVFLENRPGTLASVCDELGRQKINIYALTTSDTTDHCVVRMVVSDPERAVHVFEERGVLVVATEVLMIEGDNRPGSLSLIAKALAKVKVNIEYAYVATSPGARRGLLILRPSQLNKAFKALKFLSEPVSAKASKPSRPVKS